MELYMCGVDVGVSRLCMSDRNGSLGFSVADFDIFTGQKVMHTCVPLCVPLTFFLFVAFKFFWNIFKEWSILKLDFFSLQS